ncbi:RagB/SusD family nutrient uptake outer membrane protein [Myroides pelagicus]|uniref:RagB/SusD family nutrient uptake outer membrane protein n=1 Tax=Myroides pelagicus TaxID=270914 RepID=A0A7K1GQI8_9FLAO|nr:RagB/SusD family nutrient uptake outer membrane protein [Myroides pelagicus]MTH31028.1 RagB/SusD family nutrient uptake outer membrane protein [Myroides pelagicus]
MTHYTIQYRTVYATLISILLFTTSCTNLIEVDLPTDKIDKSEVFNDMATTKAALNNLYLDFYSSSIFSKANNGASFNLSLFTDELDFYGTNSSTKDMYENNISDIHSNITSWWNTSYQNIYSINSFIEGVSNSSYLNSDLKRPLLGEAYTLRALYFHYLSILYGDIPYTTSTNYSYNKSLNKMPYQEVLLQIESDLNKAIDLLDYSYRDPNKFYINKAVTQSILIENYIFQEQYNKAEQISRLILNQNLYEIEENLSRTFKKDSKSTIWQISPKFASNITQEASLYLFSNFTRYSATITDNLLNLFQDHDKRKQDWLQKITLSNQEFYQVYKYKNQHNNTDEFSVFYRIEQTYFHLAYSLAMQGDVKQAIETLNLLRQKRGLDNLPLNLSKLEFTTNYLEEGTREFFTENARRFIDLKITNRLNDIKLTKTNLQPYHNLLPIPFRQIEINKNLLPNNPGY